MFILHFKYKVFVKNEFNTTYAAVSKRKYQFLTLIDLEP